MDKELQVFESAIEELENICNSHVGKDDPASIVRDYCNSLNPEIARLKDEIEDLKLCLSYEREESHLWFESIRDFKAKIERKDAIVMESIRSFGEILRHLRAKNIKEALYLTNAIDDLRQALTEEDN